MGPELPPIEIVGRLAKEWAEADGITTQYAEAPGLGPITQDEAIEAAAVVEDRAGMLTRLGVDPDHWDALAAEAPVPPSEVPISPEA